MHFVLKQEYSFITPAKINIFLNILDRRADGYHNLFLDYIPISLYDTIQFVPCRKQGVTFSSQVEIRENSIIRAIALLEKLLGCTFSLSIKLKKNIPIGSGLGGGSANAAGTLVILNKIFSLGLKQTTLYDIASQLGCDVPFFIEPSPKQAKKLGYDFCHTIDIKPYPILLVVPRDSSIITTDAYHNICMRKKIYSLTEYNFEDISQVTTQWNHFWNYSSRKIILLKNIKNILLKGKADMVQMSGSGCCVYGLFQKKIQRDILYENLYKNPQYQVFKAGILPDFSYFSLLKKENFLT